MKRTIFLSLGLATCALSLTSCETTGDPTQGGLFGWSQNKADYRIAERRDTLYNLDRDNDRQQRRTQSLQSDYSRMKNSQ